MHIVKSYDQELRNLRLLVARMASLVEQQLQGAVQAIHARDNEVASIAYAADDEIDALEQEVQDLALQVLALRQPVAGDLRFIIGSMRVARDLERIGDYAANLAKRARKINAQDRISITGALVSMSSEVTTLLSRAIQALNERDNALAKNAYREDDHVDASYKKLIKDIIATMKKDSDAIDTCTHLLFMAKNLERVGDRATNIAETVIFISKGEQIPASRHPRTTNG